MLSRYRDLSEMMLERGVEIDHTTIHRCSGFLNPRFLDAQPPIVSLLVLLVQNLL
jgi:transposase-like protein